MLLQAIVAACEEAGVAPSDVDGFATYSWDKHNGTRLMHELATKELRWSSMVEGGGGGGIPAALGMAAAAIVSGQASIVAVYRTLAEREFGRFNTAIEEVHTESHYAAHGLNVAAQYVGFRTQVMLDSLGVPRSAMEALVLADYHHARNNPHAMAFGNSVDAETYRSSRVVVDPYLLFDCSRETDGASAVIVMSTDEARRRDCNPVYVLGVTQGNPFRGGDNLDNFENYGLASFGPVANRLWEQSGLGPEDVDVLQVYENFSGAGVAAIMEHGFFTPENVKEVMTFENLTVPGGKLPVNTSGGSLADGFVHGMEVLVEGVRQIRGDSVNPVPGADVCLVTGGPASTYTSSTLLGSADTL
jgi:acetyl-CoA acetyltransferase